MQPIIISRNLVSIKKYASWHKKLQQDIYYQVEENCGEDKEKNNYDLSQII